MKTLIFLAIIFICATFSPAPQVTITQDCKVPEIEAVLIFTINDKVDILHITTFEIKTDTTVELAEMIPWNCRSAYLKTTISK